MSCTNHVDVDEPLVRCARCDRDFCPDCLVLLHGRMLCETCKDEQVRDLLSGTERPPTASLGNRAAAFFVDRVILLTALAATSRGVMHLAYRVLHLDARFARIASRDAFLAVYIFVFVAEAMFVAWRGQTIGKIVCRIKVVGDRGEPAGRLQAFVRSAVTALLFFTYLGVNFFPRTWSFHRFPIVWVGVVLDYLAALFTTGARCIHDVVARTHVVKSEGA